MGSSFDESTSFGKVAQRRAQSAARVGSQATDEVDHLDANANDHGRSGPSADSGRNFNLPA